MRVLRPLLLTIATLSMFMVGVPSLAQTCGNTSTGLVPLTDMAASEYQGHTGGLYPDGANEPPSDHLEVGMEQAALVEPRNASGEPDPAGLIGMISVGVSNTKLEFDSFLDLLAGSSVINPRLVVLNEAQGSRSLEAWAEGPQANAWRNVDRDLSRAGLSPEQVQVAWVKLPAKSRGTPSLDDVEPELAQLRTVLNILSERFPNMRIAYVSSRIYAGYGGSPDSEPKAYQNGFAVKWLIEDQIDGNPQLNPDPAMGPVMAPWIAWGPYLWADGTAGRSDGLTYTCSDFDDDGIHPGEGAAEKVAAALFDHLSTDPTAESWFLESSATTADGAPPATQAATTSTMAAPPATTPGPDPTTTAPPETTATPPLGGADPAGRPTAPLVGVATAGVLLGALWGGWYEQRRRRT